jgi:hypothetical protein
MIAILRVTIGVVDKDRLPVGADFVANRSFDLKFASGLDSETNFIADTTGDPPIFGNASHCSKPHACRLADHFQDRRDDRDRTDHADVFCEFPSHKRLLYIATRRVMLENQQAVCTFPKAQQGGDVRNGVVCRQAAFAEKPSKAGIARAAQKQNAGPLARTGAC